MLDVDGTVVPYDYDALPSEKLAQTIRIIQEKISVCFVTGRSYPFLKPILKKMGMHKGYAVVNNGAHVIDLSTIRVLYNQPIDKKDVGIICDLLDKENITFYIKQGLHDADYTNYPFKKGMLIREASMIYSDEVYATEIIADIQKKLSQISDINAYRTRHKDGYGLNIQHVAATKLHGVEIILKELGVDSKQAIGIGDGHNDFSLLMACGFKVAIGNAAEELKAIADYVAPSVDEDGVVDVIEKFVLKK